MEGHQTTSNDQCSAGIVLIDLHQQRKNSQTIRISDTEYEATSCWQGADRRTATRSIRFPNQMIEQINIALEQKGPGISQPES